MTISDIISVLATGGEHLGDLVWWSLSDAQIQRSQLESKWVPTGLPASFLPEPPTIEKTLKVAVRECQVGLSDRLIRVAHEDELAVVFGVVREQRHEDGTLSYDQEAKVSLNKLSCSLSNSRNWNGSPCLAGSAPVKSSRPRPSASPRCTKTVNAGGHGRRLQASKLSS